MTRALTVFGGVAVWACIVAAQAPQGPPAGQQPGVPAQGGAPAQAGRGGGRAVITPRILNFEVKPASIKPGESVVLTWATEAGTPTIDNGVGAVPPRGTAKISPQVTTTYTMAMGDVTRSVTVTVAGTKSAAANAAAASNVATAIARIDGKPDFSGIYGFTGMASLGRGGRGAAPAAAPPSSPFASLPTQPTLKPGVENRATPNPAGGTADCLPLPADSAFGVPYPFQVF